MHNVLDYLEQNVINQPDKLVFKDEFTGYTYEEFRSKAMSVGTAILKRGYYKKPVIVFAERRVCSLISFFGVLYSGGFYVPVDPELPIERIKSIKSSLKADLILTSHQYHGTYVVEKLQEEGVDILYVEDIYDVDVEENLLKRVYETIIDTDPVYSIFTSGSTGIPKGVTVCHRSIIDLVEQFKIEFGISSEDILGNQAPFDFDVSVKDIYSTLCNGASMEIIPKVLFTQPYNLIQYLNNKKITIIIWAVSAINIVYILKALDKIIPETVRMVMFSGEAISNKVLNYWRKVLPDITYINLYGPTEITCNCSFYIVDRPFQDDEALPIGKAFRNTEIILLDNDRLIVNPEEIGEICVRGSSLALGYYNEPEKTALAFCQNPLNTSYPELIYRTGDMAYYNNWGELVFASRKDSQIKHMGHRIELGEIELNVNALEFIDNACCIFANDKIHLFYTANEECKMEIVNELSKKLPKYMCPNKYHFLEQMPMNNHGKIDRQMLRKEFLV